MERAVPAFKVPFSQFSSKCCKLRFVFVSVFSPLPISFILFKLHSSGEGAEKENQVRYDKTLSHHEYSQTALDQVFKKGWEISILAECSLQVPVSIRLHQTVFLLLFFSFIM